MYVHFWFSNAHPINFKCPHLEFTRHTKFPISLLSNLISYFSFFKKHFIYLLLQRGGGREKERERNSNVWKIHPLVASHTPPTGDLAHNPGMCPDWESNQWPFSLQAGTESTEPHQPGLSYFSNRNLSILDMIHLHMHLCVWLTQFSLFKTLSDLHILPLTRMFTILQSPPQCPLFSIILS